MEREIIEQIQANMDAIKKLAREVEHAARAVGKLNKAAGRIGAANAAYALEGAMVAVRGIAMNGHGNGSVHLLEFYPDFAAEVIAFGPPR